ncbi:N-acetyltransferase family 8 member 7 [Gadus morhua]|uniref:N-acetyltransferase family 8 member 7 n=1 Tax=Gadus morhua TaxID=8049 RepID=UPI0011B61866|nr:N-acetyltransferase family 8 member 7-like [Gadus morhua]
MQLRIRNYQDPDKETVRSLFSQGIQEHIGPSFKNAMSSPLYLCFSLGLGVTGYLLASGLGALVLVSGWAGLVYYCCHKLYADYVRGRLQADMQDIQASYMAQPDDCFWVAETVATGKVVGMVAVVAKKNGAERYGELFRMIISSATRRTGLGSRMTQAVLDFCKQRGMSKVILETSSTQTAAIALYQKLGFKHVRSYTKTHVANWMMKITRVTIVVMEKSI